MSQDTDDRASAAGAGGSGPLDAVYDDLRERARRLIAREPAGVSLFATALVHEAWLKVARHEEGIPADEGAFKGSAARAMREILVDRARARGSEKRGGAWRRISLVEPGATEEAEPVDLLALDAALIELEALDPRAVRIVEGRYFGGSAMTELAGELGVSRATAHRELAMAMAWLRRRLERGDAGES